MLFWNTACNLQQLSILFNDFFNLVLVCKDIEARLVSNYVHLINLLKHLFKKLQGSHFLRGFRQPNSVCVIWSYLIIFRESINECANCAKLIGRWQKAIKMCINSTNGRFMVDRSGKYFIFTNNLYIKNEHSVLLFVFNCQWYVIMSTNTKFRKASTCSGEVKRTNMSSTYRR